MKNSSYISQYRLLNQRIAVKSDTPDDIVRWLGAIQAQDYLGALWAIGLRTQNSTEADIEQALADRSIVRTWSARGTLHFMAAADVRWMLDLLTPRNIEQTSGRYRQLELNEVTFSRSRKLVIDALKGGNHLTRAELYLILKTANISTAGQRGIHILQRLAQDAIICFGMRDGKQQTFVLLDEWIPQTKTMAHDQALAELTRRYFKSHGPATLRDFVWWSGLKTSEARAGLEMIGPQFVQETIDGQTYWLPRAAPARKVTSTTAHLLPAFDEYLVGYQDRSAVLNPLFVKRINSGGGMLNPTIVINGQIMGTWKRTIKKESVIITPSWFTEPDDDQKHAFGKVTLQYGSFLRLPVLVASEQAQNDINTGKNEKRYRNT